MVKQHKIAILFSLFIITLIGCENEKNQKIETKKSFANRTIVVLPDQDLLWNSTNGIGVTKRNFVHLSCTETDCNGLAAIEYMSDLSGLIPGKPGNMPDSNYATDNYNDYNYDGQQDNTIHATDFSNHSLRLQSMGYLNSEFGQYPGFAIDVLGGYDGEPIVFNNKNFARTIYNPNELREVGLLFDHWPGPKKDNNNAYIHDIDGYVVFNDGNWCFKKNYRLGNFKDIEGNFWAKLNYFNTNLSGIPNSVYATADFRIAYINEITGETVRKDLLGVIFYTGNNYDLNGNPTDNIYWYDSSPFGGYNSHRLLLRGNMLGTLSTNMIGVNNVIDNSFINIKIQYKALLKKYMPAPPPGFILDDAIIVGFDVYTHVNGYDLEVGLKNVRLIGKNSQEN